MLAEQVRAVELLARSERSQAAWIAVELTTDPERAELLHAALLGPPVLKPNLHTHRQFANLSI